VKIIILGSGSGMPAKNKRSSAVLVKSQNHTFLFDCGDGCASSLLNLDLDPNTIDAIVITHYHPDHAGGLLLLIQMLYLQRRTKALSLYLPEREEDFLAMLQMFYTFPQKFSFDLQIKPMNRLNMDYNRLNIKANDHLDGYREIVRQNNLPNKIKAYSLRVSSPKGDFVYSSDISTVDCISEFCMGAHTVLVDAGHPSAEQVLRLCTLDVKRVLLTHEPRPQIKQMAKKATKDIFYEALENVEYTI